MYKYKCKYFDIRELVSPEAYELKGERCWRWFDPVALQCLDKLREKFGPMTINNWHVGGNFKNSGFHMKGEYTRSEFSGHRMWGSFDVKFKFVDSKKVRIELLGEEPTSNGVRPTIEGFEEITELEYDISWFHVRFNSNIDGVLVYKP